MPSCASVLSREILRSATAMPIKALSRLLRTDAELGAFVRIAPFRHDGAAMDHHEGGRVDLLRPGLHLGQQGFGPAGLRRRHVVPGGAWKPILGRSEAAH